MIVGVESMSGIASGGRTGLAALVTGVLFLLSTFFAPLLTSVPASATSPILVFVGVLMMEQVVNIDWSDVSIALPSFLTIVMMPFTYSISNGIFIGMLSFIFMQIVKALSPSRIRTERERESTSSHNSSGDWSLSSTPMEDEQVSGLAP